MKNLYLLEYLQGGQVTDTKLALEMIGKADWESFHQSFEEENFEVCCSCYLGVSLYELSWRV